ncbi:MAG TPA: GHKL domain-containing protein [Syntrophomonadaceae bacterium]|nr:GHKL domain-containing protein [Syntrophomonadaceae bacterium]
MKGTGLFNATCLLGLTVVLVVLGFYFQSCLLGLNLVVSRDFIMVSMLFVILATVFLSLFLTRKLLVITKQEQVVELQRLHIEHLQEMNRVIRTQRHDFVNHLQTVYGLLRLGAVEEAEAHITELYHDVQVSGEILRLAVPEVTALLMVKMGAATSRGISFKVEVESDLSRLRVRPLDSVTILGNLLNNALEAVEPMDPQSKKVELKFYENSAYIFIQTHNPGFITEEIQSQMFEPGFTTKGEDGSRGLGLTSIKHLVERYKGRVQLESHVEQGTTFTISFPQ